METDNKYPQHIDKAIYTISDEIIARRKSMVIPAITALAGVALLVLSSSLGKTEGNENLASSTFFFGLTVLIVGVVIMALRIVRKSSAPYHRPSHCSMKEYVCYFDAAKRNQVMELFNCNDLNGLDKLSSENPSPLMMISYRTSNEKVTVMQIHEYVPHRYVPASATVMHKR